MHLGNFIDVFLVRYFSDTYNHHQEHLMFSCGIWFSVPRFWWVVFLRATAWVVCAVGMVLCDTIHTTHTRPPPIQKLGAENPMLQLNI